MISSATTAADSQTRDEPSARRRTQRVVMPVLRFLLGGHIYTSVDWSLGGFQIEGYAGDLCPGTDVAVAAAGPEDAPLMPIGARARIARLKDGLLAATFIEMDGRAFDLLEAMMLRRRQYLASLAATARAVA